MAEYIEREALVHHFMTKRRYLAKDLVMDAAYEVSKFPAADVAPVVRCSCCQNLQPLDGYAWLAGECSVTKYKVTADFYCAFGQRKDGDPPDA